MARKVKFFHPPNLYCVTTLPIPVTKLSPNKTGYPFSDHPVYFNDKKQATNWE